MEILKELSCMKNVLSRISIVKELLEPIVFFYNSSRKQLLNVRNRLVRYVAEYNKGLDVIADVVLATVSEGLKKDKELLYK